MNKGLNKIIKLLIFVIVIVIIILLAKHIKEQREINTYTITLLGDNEVVIYESEEFVDPGFECVDYSGNDAKDLVVVKNNVNSNVIGEYTVDYEINTTWKKNKVSRKVIVRDNPFDTLSFSLKGDNNVTIALKSVYQDPGFNIDSGFENYVKVTDNVNVNKVGTYQNKYLLKIGTKEKELTRTVNVDGEHYEVQYDKQYTNTSVNVSLISNMNEFDYFIYNDQKMSSDVTNYTFKENGEYVVKMYLKNGQSEDIKININNIDKELPKGTCLGEYKGKTTIFNLKITDNVGISKYAINNQDYTTSNIVINGNSNYGPIKVYDKAGNVATINCNYYYQYIGPTGSTVYQYQSDTLKFWIAKRDNYYETHIWALDPYMQMNITVPNNFPSIATVKSMMQKVNTQNNLTNKGFIAVNASGFTSASFSVEIWKAMPAYKNSSVSPLVIAEGKTLRDFTNLQLPNGVYGYMYGLSKDGYLKYYPITRTIATNQKSAASIRNEGIRNIFAFQPVLLYNGKKESTSRDNNIRQVLGQVDKNNFVILTNISSNRSIGLNHSRSADILLSLGCIHGFNLDGGGSTNLGYKTKGSNTMTMLRETSRDVADILYFKEQ